MCWPVTESRFAVGSSASTIPGRVTRARAMATRWRWPPDSSLGRWLACSRRPTLSSSAITRLARSAPDSLRCSSSGSSTFWNTLSTDTRLKLWKMNPIVCRRSVVSCRSDSCRVSLPSTSTVPDVGVSTQPIRLSSVVLPLPDGPAMAMKSPSTTSSVTPRERGHDDVAQGVVLDGVLDGNDRLHAHDLRFALLRFN